MRVLRMQAGSRSSTQPSTPHIELLDLPQQAQRRQPQAAAASSPAVQPSSVLQPDLDGEEAAMLQEALSLSLQDTPHANLSATHASSSGGTSMYAADRLAPASNLSSPQSPASPSSGFSPQADAPASHSESEQPASEVTAIVHALVDNAIMAVLTKGKLPMDCWQGLEGTHSPLHAATEQHATDSIASSQQQQLSSSLARPTHAITDAADSSTGESPTATFPAQPLFQALCKSSSPSASWHICNMHVMHKACCPSSHWACDLWLPCTQWAVMVILWSQVHASCDRRFIWCSSVAHSCRHADASAASESHLILQVQAALPGHLSPMLPPSSPAWQVLLTATALD